ncbi:DUF1521 domain-containing protein [Paraburkholderia sediminicola]|uniref:DUF1521 domain-containing protein n=1 Tax=Paraburkholderia sediminicola TaxID=458836 RepID=UPI0038BDB846
MQASMQINSPLLSLQGNLSLFGGHPQSQFSPAAGFNGGRAQSQFSPAAGFNGGRAQSQFSPAAGFNGGNALPQFSSIAGFNSGRNPSSQMSNMTGGFSKTSFSVFSQTTGNGQSSTYVAQGTTVNRGPVANQQPARWGGDDHGGGNRFDSVRGSSRNDCGCHDSGRSNQTQWSNTEVSNNKAGVDLGNYKLDFDKSDSSMTMTNKNTGDTTKIWGDPHLDQHANSANKSSAMFNGPMTFQLPDNTKVTVGTQPAANNKSVSYADQVTVTRGNQAYQVTGLSEQNKAGLSVQKSRDGRALDAATPDGYTVVAARDGSGWIDPKTGKQPTASDLKKANA